MALGPFAHRLSDRYLPNLDNLPFSVAGGGLVTRILAERSRPLFRNRRVLFCINPGRSGSAYLAALLGTSPDVRAFHEPVPRMTGYYLDVALRRPMAASFRLRQIKLLGVTAALARMPPAQMYAETSHMFIKTFYDVVMEYFSRPVVVVLRRDPVKTLKSFIELGYFSSAIRHWKLWMHEAAGVCHDGADEFDRCIAYLVDIEARTEAFVRAYPSVTVHEVHLEDLATVDGARRLFADLDIEWTPGAEAACTRMVNSRSDEKRLIAKATSLRDCEARLEKFLARAKADGRPLPALYEGLA